MEMASFLRIVSGLITPSLFVLGTENVEPTKLTKLDAGSERTSKNNGAERLGQSQKWAQTQLKII